MTRYDGSEEGGVLMNDILKMEPHIILSLINTKLRDGDGDLDRLCDLYAVERRDLELLLQGIGYRYDEASGRFAAIILPTER